MESQTESKNGDGTLFGVGVGPGDPNLLTLRAVEVLRSVDVIFDISSPNTRESISAGIIDAIGGCKARRENLLFSMAKELSERKAYWEKAAGKVAAVLRQGKNAAVATIGDPLIYSTFGYLRREVLALLPEATIKLVPGITSFQAAAAEHGEPLVEDRQTLTIIPAWYQSETCHPALEATDTAVFLKTYRHRANMLSLLQKTKAFPNILYAARVGLPGQIMETDPEKIAQLSPEYLSMIITRRCPHD